MEAINQNKKIKKLSRRIRKVSSEDFFILDVSDYEMMERKKYNVKQLKAMCKHYKLKVSGNKPELIKRVFYYLKHSYFAIRIQSAIRGYLHRRFFKLRGDALATRSKCVNDTDFLTMDALSEIPHYQFFSYRDGAGFLYGFDLCSIYNLMKQNGKDMRNPYTRDEFPVSLRENVKQCIRFCRLFHYPLNIEIEDNPHNNLSEEQQLIKTIDDLFHKMDLLGFYTNASWLTHLNRSQKIRFMRELFDIWAYRAQLTTETKYKICPQHANPFFSIRLQTIHLREEKIIMKAIAKILTELVTTGADDGSKWLGASYVLSALTLVSSEAADALPWLYQSVSHQ